MLMRVNTAILIVNLVATCGARADSEGHAMTKTAIRLRANGVEATVNIDNTPAGREFLASLPLRLTLKDYNGTEKIAMLPRKLTTRGAPAGMDPSVGDFTYYAPWGNLAIFYKDFTYSTGLIALGRVEAGLDALARLDGEVKVTIEKLDESPRQ
jgi:hypothetical protein